MASHLKGPENPNWKGGKVIASNGYVLIRVGTDHHLSDVRGYAYEHRVVAEKKIGRKLKRGEQVHHINRQKQDNRPENIEVMKGVKEHRSAHRSPASKQRVPGEENYRIACECGCGEVFSKFDTNGRLRRFVSGHNLHPKGEGQ